MKRIPGPRYNISWLGIVWESMGECVSVEWLLIKWQVSSAVICETGTWWNRGRILGVPGVILLSCRPFYECWRSHNIITTISYRITIRTIYHLIAVKLDIKMRILSVSFEELIKSFFLSRYWLILGMFICRVFSFKNTRMFHLCWLCIVFHPSVCLSICPELSYLILPLPKIDRSIVSLAKW